MSEAKELPHLRDLRGLAPDAVPEGMSSEEFVRLLREGRDPWDPSDRIIRLGPAHQPAVLDVPVEELDNAAMAAYGNWVDSTEKREQTEMGMCRAIRAAVLTAAGIAIPEGYGTVCQPTWSRHSDGTSTYHTVETHETGDGYKAPMGQRVAFLPPRKEKE